MTQSLESIPSLRMNAISGAYAMSQYLELLNQGFGVPEGSQFFDDFPVWGTLLDESFGTRFGIFNESQLVATSAVRIAQLKAPQKLISVAIIGAVVTHPRWRGQGLASNLVSAAVNWAKNRGASFVLLWSSDHQLYQRLGFELCGEQVQLYLSELVSKTEVNKKEISKDFEMNEGWSSKLFSMIQKRTEGLELYAKDEMWYGSHKNVKWMWIQDQFGSPCAYVAYERGIDLKNIVHEWGGDTAFVLKLFEKIQHQNKDMKILLSPRHLRTFGVDGSEVTREFLCMARVLNPAKVIQGYYPRVQVESKFFNEKWCFKIGNNEEKNISDSEMSRLLFGPSLSHSGSTHALFPLPLWLWGLDAS